MKIFTLLYYVISFPILKFIADLCVMFISFLVPVSQNDEEVVNDVQNKDYLAEGIEDDILEPEGVMIILSLK